MKAPRLGGAILVLFSTVLTLAAGEVALIVLDQYAPPAYPPETRRADLYEFHEAYGYRLHPNLATTYDYPLENPRTLGLVANSEGFRDDRELGEPDPRPRIQVIGDSFVFGEGVEADERFTDVLENLVPGWRVDNLGMTGYGPGLMLRAFESVGRETEPEIVILCMYTDDFRRVRPYYAGVGFTIPRFERRGDGLLTVPYPRPRRWERLRLWEGVRQLRWDLTGSQWRLNEAILDRFVEHSRTGGFDLVIIFLPGDQDTPADQERRQWLAEFSRSRRVPYRDLTDAIHAPPRREVFIRRNWHLNPTGHALVAEELRGMLVAEGLVSPSGSETPR